MWKLFLAIVIKKKSRYKQATSRNQNCLSVVCGGAWGPGIIAKDILFYIQFRIFMDDLDIKK